MLTPEQKKAYINCGGALCPYCESKDMTGGNYEGDGNAISMPVTCNNCGQSWVDIYILTDVNNE